MFCSDESWGRLPFKWIESNQTINHGIILQHFAHEVEEPGVLLVTLKCCEPHQPVQSVVVGRDEAGRGCEVAGFALELVFSPHRPALLGRLAGRGLQHHLSSLLGHAEIFGFQTKLVFFPPPSPSECSVSVDNAERIKRSVHDLRRRGEIDDDGETEVGDQQSNSPGHDISPQWGRPLILLSQNFRVLL